MCALIVSACACSIGLRFALAINSESAEQNITGNLNDLVHQFLCIFTILEFCIKNTHDFWLKCLYRQNNQNPGRFIVQIVEMSKRVNFLKLQYIVVYSRVFAFWTQYIVVALQRYTSLFAFSLAFIYNEYRQKAVFPCIRSLFPCVFLVNYILCIRYQPIAFCL